MLLRASTEATWITAPEVSGKAVNKNDSYHPPPGLLQPSRLRFSSFALFKGEKKSCSEQGHSNAGKKFLEITLNCINVFKSLIPSHHRQSLAKVKQLMSHGVL